MLHADPAQFAGQPAAAPVTGAATARAVMAAQIGLLSRLAEIGLAVAETAQRRAEDDAAGVTGAAMAYARTARAVRLTLALQARLAKDLAALDATGSDAPGSAPVARPAAAAEPAAPEAADPQAARLEARRDRVERIVRRVIEADETDLDEVERLSDLCWERLIDEDVYGDLTAQPLGAVVARICEDLDLSPDWTRLAREAWAVAEAQSGAPNSPFVALGARGGGGVGPPGGLSGPS